MFNFFFPLFLIFHLLFSTNVLAQDIPNNKFGIHLAQPSDHDLEAATKLVNSSGGDWGYVTLVIQENDRDKNKWQEIFNKLRRLHLIPIVRLATKPDGSFWRRPSLEDIPSWVNFLDSLNWVVKNRYVILFNEPNHASEWGGAVDPENYAEIAFRFAQSLKEKNPDFFVMLAGFDAAAPSNPPYFEDEEIFLQKMLARAKNLTHNNNSQKNGNQSKSKGNLDISVDIPNIKVFHTDSFSKKKLITKKNILQKTLTVNTQTAFGWFREPKFGTIKTAAIHPADKLIDSSERILNNAFIDFLRNFTFIRPIIAQEKDDVKKNLFNYIDGWTSHSYPKDYIGSPYSIGRNSVRTYEWELNLLRNLGITKELPVFITETGWRRKTQNSKLKTQNYLDSETIGKYFQIAFENVWLPDQRVWAVTPFILNYQQDPFLEFSWRMVGEGDFYPHYYLVQSLPKTKGEPIQKIKLTLMTDLPTEIVEGSTYLFPINIKNEGQVILNKDYQLKIDSNEFESLFSNFEDLEPFNEQLINFHLKTKENLGKKSSKLSLFKGENKVLDLFTWDFKVLPWPSLNFKVSLFPKIKTKGEDFEIQIFDKNERLVYKKKNIKVDNGKGNLERIANIVLGERYRVVILKPYYLPRQTSVIFQKDNNQVIFQPMLPLDLNLDGKFSLSDLLIFIKKPEFLLP